MAGNIFIVICILLLIAYFFELTTSRTRIPSVILLLLLGWGVQQLTVYTGIQLPDFSPLLPVLGTTGLIMIVLEGSLELELNRNKIAVIRKSFLGSVISLSVLAFILSWYFTYEHGGNLINNLINAVPFCVISSAIAIPAVRNISADNREFVIYESSLSDIVGILFFNFLVLNEVIDSLAFGTFLFQFLIMMVIAVSGACGLAYLLHKIEHHIKFIPVIILVLLIYSIAKFYHLPALLFVLIFGLFAGNISLFKNVPLIKRLHTESFSQEIAKMKELTIEITFLIRSLFFLLFGYVINTHELLNPETLILSLIIVFLIYTIRFVQIRLSGLPLLPLLFIAPRGLITVLLFLSIVPEQSVPFVNKSLVIQVVILTALMMMMGLMFDKKGKTGNVNDSN